MKKFRKVLASAQEGLEKAISMKTTEGDVGEVLLITLKNLLKDLQPLIESCEKEPAWLTQRSKVIDYEVLVVVSQELAGMHEILDIEDSRALEQVCLEAAEIFTEHHSSDDPDYWGKRDFLDELLKYCHHIRKALEEEPTWINKEHNSMYGSETVGDLLKKHFERAFPMRILDPLQNNNRRILNIRVDDQTVILVNRETGCFHKVVNGVTEVGFATYENSTEV
jgi:hypothetical protein